jgi:hypothetical protein
VPRRRWSIGSKECIITTNPLKVPPTRVASEQDTDELARVARVPRPRSRSSRIDSWAMPVIRILPYLLAALVVIVPLVLASAGDSLLASYEGIREAFGRGKVINGVAGLLQILLFAIAVAGLALTFALVGRRLGAIVWRWSEGKPILRAGLSSVRFGLAIVAVATVGVALFTWLPSGDRATADGGTLKEAMERAGNQVAALLGAESDTASAEEAGSEASEPTGFSGILDSLLPGGGREEERSDASESSKSSQGSSSERANPTEQDSQETASSPEQRTNEPSPEPDPVALAPRESVPTLVEAPPVILEEPTSPPTAPPIPPIEEPATQEEPVAEEPPVAYEPPPLVEEPPTAEEPAPPGPPTEVVTPATPLGTPKASPINCTTSPGEAPGTTSTRCTT